jgi:hypothetical protein
MHNIAENPDVFQQWKNKSSEACSDKCGPNLAVIPINNSYMD